MEKPNTSTISVTDVVNLIIDKNIKKIDDEINDKQNIIKELKDKHYNNIDEKVEKLKNFLTEHFDERGLKHLLMLMGMGMGGRGGGWNDMGGKISFGADIREHSGYKELFLCGLFLKGDDVEYETINNLYDEIDQLRNKQYKIRNSKDNLIAEVTLERLSNIDVDFKLDLLADRIFNNIPKGIK